MADPCGGGGGGGGFGGGFSGGFDGGFNGGFDGGFGGANGGVPFVPICDVKVCLQSCRNHFGYGQAACVDNECYCKEGEGEEGQAVDGGG